MLLGRLRVRQKLALLVLPLLVLVVIGAVPLVSTRIAAAERSSRSADVIQRAVRIGELAQELQQERLASLGYLAGLERRDRVVARSARVLDLGEQLAADYGGGDDRLDSALRAVSDRSSLEGIRIQVLGQRIAGIGVYTGFTEVVDDLIGLLRLTDGIDLRSDIGRKQFALDSIIRHDEASASAGAALFIEQGRRISPRVIARVSAGQAVQDREERVFVPLADPSAVELYRDVEGGQSSRTVSDYFDRVMQLDPGSVNTASVPADLLPKVESLTSLARLVETRAAAQAVDGAAQSARRDNWLAGIGITLALLVLIGAGVLSILVARSIARPLRRLTASADEVADVAQQELVRVADTEDPQAAAPQLRPVRVGTADELGELAKAFNRVQQVAADLVERQVVSRRNVATMFGNVGRRTQNLVGRQLAMIDSLERNEQDPVLLDRLYRLDHVSTRLRRNANSLVVLSGAVDPEMTGEPLSVGDTIRSALGEIEGFQRVRLTEVEPVLLTPHVTPDVILLLAELLENGTSFSPPNTEVEVGARTVASGDVQVRIVDHGLGMTPEQLAAENARLVERERLDMAPTDVLGLFVVGRLARRHGIRVTLQATQGSGVTAEVLVPAGMVVRPAVAPLPPAPRPVATPEAVPAVPAVPAGARLAGGGGAAVPVAPVAPGAPGGPGGPGAPGAPGGPGDEGPRGWWEPAAPAADGTDAAAEDEAGAAAERARPPLPPAPAGGGIGGIRRRVRGAQLPDTGPPPADEQPRDRVQPADEARRSIEDFEDGVRRAQQESAAHRDAGGRPPNGHAHDVPGIRAVPPLPPLTPPVAPAEGRRPGDEPADPTRALVEEFEDGVRRALARLESVSGAGEPATFFERPGSPLNGNGNGNHPARPPARTALPPDLSPTPTPAAHPTPPPAAPPPAASGDPVPPGVAPGGFRSGAEAPPAADPAGASVGDQPAEAPAGERGPVAPAPPLGSIPPAPVDSDRTPGPAGPDNSPSLPGGNSPASEVGERGLTRRVPGAQLPAGARAARPGRPAPEPVASADAAVQEAAAARALVEEFEAGVERALRAGAPTGETDGTSEEGAG